MRPEASPHLVVLTSLFPSSTHPGAGIFVRERMMRVAQHLPVAVVAPAPWFPVQSWVRRWRPGFRPESPRHERQEGIDVWRPRFVCVPGALKSLDGMSMALGVLPRLRELKRAGRLDVLDAHFGYPEGYAAVQLGRWLDVPVTITLRGTEPRHSNEPALRRRLIEALAGATRIYSVSESLRKLAMSLGIAPDRVQAIGNGVDLVKFDIVDKAEARRRLGLANGAKVLISVGGLVERKGFHRVIELLPELRRRFPALVYLVAGGPGPEGDWTVRLADQVSALGLTDCVRFLGPAPSAELKVPLSAADAFVLATANEGWANVFLEAMACGLPVITTDVGGNSEVIADRSFGTVVPFGDPQVLRAAIVEALERGWDRAAIRRYAEGNSWDGRVAALVEEFRTIAAEGMHYPGVRLRAGGKPRSP